MNAFVILVALLWNSTTTVEFRQWTDSSGHYQVTADLIGHSESVVILQKENGQLVSVPIEKLSESDQEFLKSKDAAEHLAQNDPMQTWTTKSGVKVRGKVLDYAQREVVLQRRRGKVYVNDQEFSNLPAVYQKMIPRIVSHFTEKEIKDEKELEAWVARDKGAPKSFQCDGVLLELENGNLYNVPFFFFSDEDREALEPGWERWLAAKDDATARERESVALESMARAYQSDRKAKGQAMQLQLQLQAYDAGLFDLWEVQLLPANTRGAPLLVVVPGRDSQQASAEAINRYPGYRVGGIAKVRRKR